MLTGHGMSLSGNCHKVHLPLNQLGRSCVWIETDMTAAIRTEALKAMNDEILLRTPAARWGDPQELIGAAVFLSSKASDFVNGHLLFVDGGMLAAV